MPLIDNLDWTIAIVLYLYILYYKLTHWRHVSQCVILFHNSQPCAASSPLMSHITLSQPSHTVILHNPICSYSGGVDLGRSRWCKFRKTTANERYCPHVSDRISPVSLHEPRTDAPIAWQPKSQLVVHISRQPAVTSPENAAHSANCSTQDKQSKAILMDTEVARQVGRQKPTGRNAAVFTCRGDMTFRAL